MLRSGISSLLAALLAASSLPSCGRFGYDPLREAGANSGNPDQLTNGSWQDAADTGAVREPDGGLLGVGGGSALDAGLVPSPDAGQPSADAGASGAGATPLEDLGAFGSPTLVAGLLGPGETADDPSFTDDRRLLYFNSDRPGGPGGGDIWVAVRASAPGPWSSPMLSSVSTAAEETTPGVSPDGLTLWFSSDREGPGACAAGGGLDIWVATRATRGDSFGPAVCVDELSGPGDERGPAPSADGSSIVFTRNVAGFGRLFEATRGAPDEPFGDPAPIPGLGGDFNEGDASLGRGARELFFATDRGEAASSRIMTSARDSPAAPFGAVVELPELDGAGSSSDPWVSSDARHIMWVSDRSGTMQLYEASR